MNDGHVRSDLEAAGLLGGIQSNVVSAQQNIEKASVFGTVWYKEKKNLFTFD